jgi:hypothetical protein
VPPLQPSDLATLGDDTAQQQQQPQPPGGPMMKRPGRPGMWFGSYASWVVTRLHTRYSKETLSEDLVFREAKPVTGGRANWDGTSGDAGAQVTEAGVNNFQGRYIIRHYWEGAVTCDNPVYNRWGGPPSGEHYTGPAAAKGLANATRGQVALKSVVRSPVPTLGIAGQPPPRRKK